MIILMGNGQMNLRVSFLSVSLMGMSQVADLGVGSWGL